MPSREQCAIEGLAVEGWVALWQACHTFGEGGIPIRIAWPDGRATLRQPAITVAMFELIDDEHMKEMADAARREEAKVPGG